MAAVRECDNAITKSALLFGAILKNAYKFPDLDAYGRLADTPENDPQQTVVLEGGQGFTPSHTIRQIETRLTDAATDAVKKYCRLRGRKFEARMIQMSFDRLRNDAYAQSPDTAPMGALREACTAVGHPPGPPSAWTTSCDARIYHHKGYPVAVFGAGRLEAAHSASEYVDLADLQKALTISTLATLLLTSK
jgi:acetylornithine deacetylase/succinyl-diaminopimelate desuccinylase-like protein